jgi:excisionase family DNA binding protein
MSKIPHKNDTEFTIEEAADLINVSRSFLIQQMDAGKLSYRIVGQHCWINFNDLLAYKKQVDRTASEALDEMVAISQELGFYD